MDSKDHEAWKGTGTLLGTGLEAIDYKNLFNFAHALRLWEPCYKDDRQTKLVEEISWQPSIQAVAWLLLSAFNQV